MKKMNLLVALASVMLATSCAEDIESSKAMSNSTISVHPTMGSLTRAAETTTANLQSFKTYAFQSGDDKNYMDGVTYNNAGGEWTTSQGSFYWPVSGDLNFFSYAPEKPGETGEFTVTPTVQKLTGFTPFPTADTQQDFIYANASGNLKSNGTSGVDINFSHALSEITVAAKNDNKAYTVEVSGVKVGNVISKGDFTFPTLEGGDAAWTLGTDKSDYTTEWNSATTLSADASTLDASNTAFMLIPQQLEANDKAIDGNYIALKVKITMQGGQVVHDGWAYVAVPTLWEMGKHYNYTLDYSNGAGQDENGNEIISGTGIKFNVTVTPWDEEGYVYPVLIKGKVGNIQTFNIYINDDIKVPVTPNDDGTFKCEIKNLKITSLYKLCRGCNYLLREVNLNNFDTQNVTTMEQAFGDGTNGCIWLTTLDLSGWNTSKVTSMKYMFGACRELKSINLKGWDTSNVTDMYGMFQNCYKLEKLDLSGFDTHNVTDMGDMFYIENLSWYPDGSSLKVLNLSSFDTSNVTTMRCMFTGCNALETLDLSSFDTHNVTYMFGMFQGCSSLTSLDLSNFDTSNVTYMNYMFGGNEKYSGCSSLTSLDLSKWNVSKVYSMTGMFKKCVKLETIDMSGWDISNVKKMSYIFDGCISLKNIFMVGCNEETINKIKSALTSAGLSTDIVKTSR